MSNIKRTDIETKLREIQDEMDEATTAAMPAGIAVGAAVFSGAVGLAYLIGQRKARRRTTIVEVRQT